MMDQKTYTDGLARDQHALVAAITQVLAPLARLCLAKGLSIQTTESLLRKAFVDAARQSCGGLNPGRLTSRISTMTGLTRREVDRIQSTPAAITVAVRSVALEVLTRWVSDRGYLDAHGAPRVLPRNGPAPSFEALAQSVTTDVHTRSVLSEMERLGLARVDDLGQVTLIESIFVPSDDWPRMAQYLGDHVGDHFQSAVDNLLGDGHQHFEQAILADELSEASIEQAKSLITAQWRNMMTTLIPELQRLIDADRDAARPARRQLRVGLYSHTTAMKDTQE